MKRPIIKKTTISQTGFFKVRQDLLENHHGRTTIYTSLSLPNAVSILAQTKEGLWILNREYRHPAGEILLGAPGGRLEENEDPVLGGQREMFEETGYWSDEIELIGCSHPFPGVSDQKIYYLWAKNAIKKGEQNLEPFEFIEVALLDDAALRKELRSGRHIDGILCTALWYKDHLSH